MSYIKEKKIIYVHSELRLSGDTTNFTYDLQLQKLDYDYCVVLGLSVPKSYYNIPTNENTFILNEINQSTTITIPVGSYTRTNLKTTLQSILTSSSPNGWIYTVSIPATTIGDTGKYTFVVTGNGGIQPQFIFSNNFFQQLGFNSNSTNTFSSSSLTSTNVIYLQSQSVLYLHSDLVSNDGDNILQEVYGVSDQSFSSIVYQCQDVLSYSKKITSSTRVATFYLTDDTNNFLDIGGLNFHFTLLLYKKEDIYQLMANFMRYQLLTSN